MVYLIITGVVSLLNGTSSATAYCQDSFDIINHENDRKHQRSWAFADHSNSFCAEYISIESQSLAVGTFRNEIIYNTDFSYENFWGSVYQELIQNSKLNIGFLIDSLKAISVERSLSKREGVDYQKFLERFESEEIRYETNAEFSLNRQWGVQGYPTMVLLHKDQLFMIAHGYATFDQMKAQVEKTIEEVGVKD